MNFFLCFSLFQTLFCNKHFDSKFYASVSLCKMLMFEEFLTVWWFKSFLCYSLCNISTLLCPSFLSIFFLSFERIWDILCLWLYLNVGKPENIYYAIKNAVLDFCSEWFNHTNYSKSSSHSTSPSDNKYPQKARPTAFARVFVVAICPSLGSVVASALLPRQQVSFCTR